MNNYRQYDEVLSEEDANALIERLTQGRMHNEEANSRPTLSEVAEVSNVAPDYAAIMMENIRLQRVLAQNQKDAASSRAAQSSIDQRLQALEERASQRSGHRRSGFWDAVITCASLYFVYMLITTIFGINRPFFPAIHVSKDGASVVAPADANPGNGGTGTTGFTTSAPATVSKTTPDVPTVPAQNSPN